MSLSSPIPPQAVAVVTGVPVRLPQGSRQADENNGNTILRKEEAESKLKELNKR